MTKKNFIPLDGGWGWIIVCAYALSSFMVAAMTQGFGMIYGEKFEAMGITATEISIIMNVNQGFGLMVGLVSVPLLRVYGYRKMAIFGQLLYSSGLILTSFATCFIHFIVTYGMMTSLGSSVNMAAISIALHAYFEKKKGRAVGLSLMMTGVGAIILPQLISAMLPTYGSQGTMLLLGATSLNHLVGGFLLQPLKWHAKRVKKTGDDSENLEADMTNKFTMHYDIQEIITYDNKIENKQMININQVSTISNMNSINGNFGYEYGYEKPSIMKENCILNVQGWFPKNKDSNAESNCEFIERPPKSDLKYSSKRSSSFHEIKLPKGSFISLKLENFNVRNMMFNKENEKNSKFKKTIEGGNIETVTCNSEVLAGETANETIKKERKSWPLSVINQMIELFDLELLRNRTFMILAVGTSMVMFAEMNFNALMPLILAEMNLEMEDIATTLSTVGLSELVLRGLSPYVGEWLHRPPIAMFLFSLSMLVLTRTALLFIKTRMSIMIFGVCLGISKGFRIVYMNVLIPNCVSIERLAAANSIQTFLHGCISCLGSPVLGLIKDFSGSYYLCIIFLNVITSTVFLFMLLKITVKYIRKRRKLSTFYKLQQITK